MGLTLNSLRKICKLDSTDGLSENAILQNPNILQKCQSHTVVAMILGSTLNLTNNLCEV